MPHLQNLLLWTSAINSPKNRKDAFADPLESPEWQPFLKAFMFFTKW